MLSRNAALARGVLLCVANAGMTTTRPVPGDQGRLLAAFGALLAALSVALSAYAAHAASGTDQSRLQTAAVFAFGHGLALAALAPGNVQPIARWALRGMGVGVLLFAASIAGTVIAHWPMTLAPAGGLLMISAWLVLAFALLRR